MVCPAFLCLITPEGNFCTFTFLSVTRVPARPSVYVQARYVELLLQLRSQVKLRKQKAGLSLMGSQGLELHAEGSNDKREKRLQEACAKLEADPELNIPLGVQHSTGRGCGMCSSRGSCASQSASGAGGGPPMMAEDHCHLPPPPPGSGRIVDRRALLPMWGCIPAPGVPQ